MAPWQLDYPHHSRLWTRGVRRVHGPLAFGSYADTRERDSAVSPIETAARAGDYRVGGVVVLIASEPTQGADRNAVVEQFLSSGRSEPPWRFAYGEVAGLGPETRDPFPGAGGQ